MSMPVVSSAVAKPPEFDDPAFRRRRTQNWMVLGLLYALFYMSRYNFAASMTPIGALFGWTNVQLGVFETVLPLIYGISVVINGPISDRIGGRRAFLFGAAGVTVASFAFGACFLLVQSPAEVVGSGHDAKVIKEAVIGHGFTSGQVLALMATIWGFNAYFQSFGALSIVKVNAHWFHIRERGPFAGVFGVLIRFGLLLAFSGVPLIWAHMPLQFAFWIPGALVGIFFALNYALMQNGPAEAGFGDLDTGDEQDEHGSKPIPLTEILTKIFASRALWTIAFASMMLGVVRRSTVDSWYPKYFTQTYAKPAGIGLDALPSYQAAAWGIALVGIAGGFAFGFISEKRFGSRRAPIATIGFVGAALSLVLLGLSQQLELGQWGAAAALAVLSFFVNGTHGMVVGAASMDFGGKKAAATAAGMFDGMQYLASSFIGVGMGYILDHWGWTAWPWVPIPFALVGAVLISRLWHVTTGRRVPAVTPAPSAGTPTHG